MHVSKSGWVSSQYSLHSPRSTWLVRVYSLSHGDTRPRDTRTMRIIGGSPVHPYCLCEWQTGSWNVLFKARSRLVPKYNLGTRNPSGLSFILQHSPLGSRTPSIYIAHGVALSKGTYDCGLLRKLRAVFGMRTRLRAQGCVRNG